MHIIGALDALSESISTFVKNGETIGFVPTMGALHEGHLALVELSKRQNDITVVSIFVNPLQFNSAEDLKKYPRVLKDDLELLSKHAVDLVFTPSEEDFYAEQPMISINFGMLASKLEGEFRSGHFEGVGVVVSKLLHLVRPERAYFGLKDLQQFILIRRMCTDLSFPCEIVGVDTVRESSGLAMSSRNRLLSEEGKSEAAVINRGLNMARNSIDEGMPVNQMLAKVRNLYNDSEKFKLEYLEAINPHDFSKVDNYENLDELAVCVAGYVEGVRLIDNLYLRLK